MVFDRREQQAAGELAAAQNQHNLMTNSGSQGLGTSFDLAGSGLVGQQRFNSFLTDNQQRFLRHPLFQPFFEAWAQAADGKGERHGGDSMSFMNQPWKHIADSQGTGFLTGQAAKKITEAGVRMQKIIADPGTPSQHDEVWRREILGAVVYLGMALLHTAQPSAGAQPDQSTRPRNQLKDC